MHEISTWLYALKAKDGVWKTNPETVARAVENDQDLPSWKKSAVADYIRKGDVTGVDAADLDPTGSSVLADFQAAARAASSLQFLVEHGMRQIVLNTPTLTQNSQSAAHFYSSGESRKLSLGSYTRSALKPKNVSGSAVFTREAFANPIWQAQRGIEVDILGAIGEAVDDALFDPANAGSDSTPASIFSGCTPIELTAGTLAALDIAARAALAALSAGGADAKRSVWIASPATAAALATARDSSGGLAFPAMGAGGGALYGLPCAVSAGLSADSDGGHLGLIDATAISYGEDQPSLQTSTAATIEMSDSPTGNTEAPTAQSQVPVSLFQNDLVGAIVSLRINWQLRHAACAQLIAAIPSTLTAA